MPRYFCGGCGGALLLALAAFVQAQQNPDYCTDADHPNAWGGWSEWSACDAIGPGLSGFQTQKATRCFKADSSGQPTVASASTGCAPRADAAFRLCSNRMRQCTSPVEDYQWVFTVDFSACGQATDPCNATGAYLTGLCCASVDSEGNQCLQAYRPETNCTGYDATRQLAVPCLSALTCDGTGVNYVSFLGRCLSLTQQALLLRQLAILLGLAPDDAVLTQTANCDASADASRMGFFFTGKGAATAQKVFESELQSGGSSVYNFMVANAVQTVALPNRDPLNIVYCGEPLKLPKTDLAAKGKADHYGWGDTVQYTCDCDGCGKFRTGSCQKSGLWEFSKTLCPGDDGSQEPGPVACPDPPEILHGTIKSGKADAYSPGDKVTYECAEKYKFEGKGAITCLKTGLWDAYPKCILIPLWELPTTASPTPTPWLPPPGSTLKPPVPVPVPTPTP